MVLSKFLWKNFTEIPNFREKKKILYVKGNSWVETHRYVCIGEIGKLYIYKYITHIYVYIYILYITIARKINVTPKGVRLSEKLQYSVMKFDRSNKFDLCYYGQVNSLLLK